MDKFLFILPYFVAVAVSLGVLIYTWRFCNVRGAKAYACYVAGQCLWGIGYIFELVSKTIGAKVFWDQVQWVAALFITISFPVFAIQYTQTKVRQPRYLFVISLFVPLLFLGLLLTDNQHHLLYPNPHLDHSVIYSDLKYEFTWVVYTFAFYSYLITFTGLGILLRRVIEPYHLYRRQIATVAVGFFIPVFFTILTIFGVEFMPFRDISPFTFAFGNLIIAWGLFRYHLFDIIPIARDLIIENMEDLIVVLDKQDRIVDINASALVAVNKKSRDVIGQPVETVLAKWPDLLKKFTSPENVKTETVIYTGGRPYQHEVKSTLLYDNRGRFLGRSFVSRDITEHTILKSQLQGLNEDLEERVANRTEELRRSAERYRAVVEHQTEFIVRWNLEGTGTFVNEAYCRYFGFTQEEAKRTHFSLLVHEKYLPALKEKSFRLWSGELDSATNVYQVKRPDGNYGWQEWTDHAIRDETGQVIEIQSVGRDITETKQAEIALQESEQKHRQLFEAANDSIFILKDDHIIECNSKTLEMFGCEQEQIIGKTPADLSPDTQPNGQSSEEMSHEKIKAVLEGKSQFFEWKHYRLDKTPFDAEVSLNTLKIDGEIYIQAIVRDITERKQAEEKIRKQLAFEELMTDILTRFATCSHDAIDDNIQNALQKVAAFTGIERCYIIIIEPELRKTWSTMHEWRASHVPPPSMARQKVPFGTFSWTENLILGGIVTKINTLDNYPPEASGDRQLHHAEGVQSILNVPIRGSDGPVSGCIGGQTYSYPRTWSDDDVNHLKMIGDAISNLLERKHAEEMLLKAYDTTLEGWAKALELRDKETEDHSRRVTELTVKLAQAIGIEGEELAHIRRGAILHDIGKMAIPDDILRKPGKLTVEERKVMEQHPVHSHALLSSIPFLEKALEIPYCHHEHWDGSGYPRGLKGEEIPLAARIFAVVDVWDAVQSDRPYNIAWSREVAIELIKNSSGTHFDPGIVDVFLELVERDEI